MQTLSKRHVGTFCFVAILMLMALSVPLRCIVLALQVGAVTGFAGAFMGVALAMITKTRRPALIYLWLGATFLSLAPLALSFPSADETDVHLWKGAPSIASNYFDALRMGVFLLAIPYPFARLGHHATDFASDIPNPAENKKENEEDISDPNETSVL